MAASGDEHDPVVRDAHGQMACVKEAKVPDVVGDHGSSICNRPREDILIRDSSELRFRDRDHIVSAPPELFGDFY